MGDSGECATHFGQILAKFPPQVKSRSTAAAWGCHVHNEVNKHLHKNIFDCSKIGDFYDCGCGDDDQIKKQTTSGDSKPDMTAEQVERITGSNGRDVDEDILTGKKPVPRDVTNHE